MDQFVVSARKYRPQRFEEVVGQEGVTTTLKNAIRSGHLAHAFLFCGPRGVGKTTCARILAKMINSKHPVDEFDPAKEAELDDNFNIYELDAASNNSVEDIRALVDQVRFPPQAGRYKVYIIDEVHMLSQAAFNAFLKTLEEPPPYAIFILATTEKHKIIPTILSRCQIFDFNRIMIPDVVGHLQKICDQEGITADPNALHILGEKADGALRDALSLFDRMVNYADKTVTYESVISNLNILDHEYFFKVTDYLMAQDLTGAMLSFDEVIRNGFEGDNFIGGLAAHFRNLMVSQDESTVKLLEVSGDLKARYLEQANLIPQYFLLNALNIANSCEIEYKTSKNKRLHVEIALMKMCYIPAAVDFIQAGGATTAKKKPLAELSQTKAEDYQATPRPEPVATETPVEQKEPVPNIPEESAPVEEAQSETAPEAVEETVETPQPEEPVQEQKTEEEVVDEEPSAEPVEPETATVSNEEKPVTEVQEEAVDEPVEEKEVAAPKLNKKIPSDLLNLTGGGLIKEAEESVAKEQKNQKKTVQFDDVTIDKDAFVQAWGAYVEFLKTDGQVVLHSLLKEVTPDVEEKAIVIPVTGSYQEMEVEGGRAGMSDFLNGQLGYRPLIKLNRIAEPEKKAKAFTSKEKLQKMVDKNPSVKDLQQRLDLHTDH